VGIGFVAQAQLKNHLQNSSDFRLTENAFFALFNILLMFILELVGVS